MTGYVYLIGCGDYVKIGRASGADREAAAKRVAGRLMSFRVGNPYPLLLVAYAWVDDVVREERELHEKYEASRHRGEWFKLPEADLLALATEFQAQNIDRITDAAKVDELIKAEQWGRLTLSTRSFGSRSFRDAAIRRAEEN